MKQHWNCFKATKIQGQDGHWGLGLDSFSIVSFDTFLGLAIWYSLKQDTFVESDTFFLGVGATGTAAHRYCEQLADMLKTFADIVCTFAHPGRTKTHGTQEGAAIHTTSGTTCPPPMLSVANRGEWSQGSVVDVYFLFAEPGNQYLGRCLVGLDPNSHDFAYGFRGPERCAWDRHMLWRSWYSICMQWDPFVPPC